jgi:hypothetical protein
MRHSTATADARIDVYHNTALFQVLGTVTGRDRNRGSGLGWAVT